MTEFNLLRAESDGRLFLRIFTETTHFVVEIDENELSELRERLNRPPESVDR